jgi:hypothetical protein
VSKSNENAKAFAISSAALVMSFSDLNVNVLLFTIAL